MYISRAVGRTHSSAIPRSIPAAHGAKLFWAAVWSLFFLLAFGSSALAQASLSPSTLSFGTVALGEESISKTSILKNKQTVPLKISSILISGGTAPGDFAQSGNCPISPNTLGAGLSCSITVIFTPTGLGTQTASLTVTDGASNSPQSIALQGTGISPVTLLPAALPFGVQAEGTTSAAKTATLKNVQTAPLTISHIAISGTASTDYAWSGNCPVSPNTLGAGLSCSVTVTFTPTSLGTRMASLTVTDGASNSPQSIALQGTGTAPVTVAPTSRTFASRLVGTTSTTQTVTVINDLSTELLISSVIASGDFAVASNTCGSAISAGVKCTIGLTFTPTRVGPRQGTLTISDNAFGSPSLVSLSGTGNDLGLNSISVTPAEPWISAGKTQQFVATGHLTNGTTQDLTPYVTWGSDQSDVATITSGGLATGLTPATSSISARVGGVSGSAALTVTEPGLIEVTPADSSMAAGKTQTFRATGSSTNAGVDWSVTCGSAGACGSFNPTHTASGSPTTYTAPSAVPFGNAVTVSATSTADKTESASANVEIATKVMIIAVDVGFPLDSSIQAILPFVDGVTIFVNWAGLSSSTDTTICTVAPCTQTTDFTSYDKAIAAYTSATCGASLRGKGSPCIVNLTFPPVSSLTNYNSNTPTWVFSQAWADTVGSPVQDAAFCSYYPQNPNADPLAPAAAIANIDTTNCGSAGTTQCTAATVATGVPAIWETPYVTAINNWHQAIIQHYANATYPAYLRLGVSISSEAEVTCSTINSVAGTGLESLTSPANADGLKAAWTGAAVNQIVFNASQLATLSPPPTWQLMNTVNMGQRLETVNGDGGIDASWAVIEADAILANQPYAIGTEGLANGTLGSDVNNVWNTTCSGPDCCSDDWCNVHSMVEGKVPAIELQTCNLSNPAGGTANCLDCLQAGTCTDDSQTLAQVLALSAQHGTTFQELYLGEFQCAFDQASYVSLAPTCTPSVSTAYAAAIRALATGQ
jgi:hypothetical protein